MDPLSNTLPHYCHCLQAVLLPFDTDCPNIPSYFLMSSLLSNCLFFINDGLYFDILLWYPSPATTPNPPLSADLPASPGPSLSLLSSCFVFVNTGLFFDTLFGAYPNPKQSHPFPLTYLLLQVPHCPHYRLVVWSLSILACSWIYFFEHIPTPSKTPTPLHWPTFFSRPLSVFIIVLLYDLFQYWLVLGYTSLSIFQPLNNPPSPLHWPTFFSRPLTVFIIVLLYGLCQYWLVLRYTSQGWNIKDSFSKQDTKRSFAPFPYCCWL